MANYRKSFNFRNGVQVDNDNFIVNANGLVGIGTSLPTEFLDVKGNIAVSGVVTTSDLWVSEDVNIVGMITATQGNYTGVVTATKFIGDGSALLGVAGIAKTGWVVENDAGISTTSNVGIGTTNPLTFLQIGNSPTTGTGVGIDSTGNAVFAGIITAGGYEATGFIKSVDLNVTGVSTFSSAVDINSTLDVDGDTQLDDLNVAGVATITGAIDANGGANVVGGVSIDGLNVTGISTFGDDVRFTAGGIDVSGIGSFTQLDIGTGGIDVDGQTDLDVLNVAEAATFSAAIDANGSLDVDGDTQLDDLTVAGVATFSSNIDANGDLDVDGNTELDALNVSGITTFAGAVDINSTLDVDGDTQLDDLNVAGVATFSNDIKIQKDSSLLLQVIADTGSSRISIGNSVGVGNSTALFRYGTQANTLDIINNDTGNVNMYLHKGGAGINTGRFDWIYGQTNADLMSLTLEGRLGLGKTNPDNTLHVVGTSTVTSNAWVGGNLVISGNMSAGTVTLPTVVNGTNLNNTTGVSTFNNVNLTGKIGLNNTSPRTELDFFSGTGLFQGVGIGTTNPLATVEVKGLSSLDNVGIGTTALQTVVGIVTDAALGNVQIHGKKTTIWGETLTIADNTSSSRLGVGTYAPRCAVDFSGAGEGTMGATAGFMLLPKVTTSVRNNFQVAAPAAIIYNETTDRLEVRLGGNWIGIATVP